MKNYLYDVVFGIDHVEVYAGCTLDAAILAVAQRIGEGKSTQIDQIYDCDAEDFDVLFSCKLTIVGVE